MPDRRLLLAVFVASSLACASPHALAQTQATPPRHAIDLGTGYIYFHGNAPPGGCGCFSGNGANASIQYHLTRSLGLVADFGITASGNLVGSTENLKLFTYTFGPRYYLRAVRLRSVHPFAETLLGLAHTTSNYTYADGDNGVALLAGGGLDIALGHRLSLRAPQVDYVFTKIRNGTNNRQDSLRLGVGLVFHLK